VISYQLLARKNKLYDIISLRKLIIFPIPSWNSLAVVVDVMRLRVIEGGRDDLHQAHSRVTLSAADYVIGLAHQAILQLA
jgi:hypothetical protein